MDYDFWPHVGLTDDETKKWIDAAQFAGDQWVFDFESASFESTFGFSNIVYENRTEFEADIKDVIGVSMDEDFDVDELVGALGAEDFEAIGQLVGMANELDTEEKLFYDHMPADVFDDVFNVQMEQDIADELKMEPLPERSFQVGKIDVQFQYRYKMEKDGRALVAHDAQILGRDFIFFQGQQPIEDGEVPEMFTLGTVFSHRSIVADGSLVAASMSPQRKTSMVLCTKRKTPQVVVYSFEDDIEIKLNDPLRFPGNAVHNIPKSTAVQFNYLCLNVWSLKNATIKGHHTFNYVTNNKTNLQTVERGASKITLFHYFDGDIRGEVVDLNRGKMFFVMIDELSSRLGVVGAKTVEPQTDCYFEPLVNMYLPYFIKFVPGKHLNK